MLRITFVLLISMLFLIPTSEGQLFKKLADRTADKIAQRAEDKLVEGVSNEIANRAMRPIDKAFDDIFRASYKEQYGKEWDDSEYEGDPEARANAMTNILNQMYGNVELPEQYQFDYEIEIEVYNEGEKKPQKTILLLSKESSIMGATQKQDGNEMIMVYDLEADKVAIFNEDEKTVMAMAGVMSMASQMAQMHKSDNNDNWDDMEITKTGKSKKIAGYNSDEYKMKSKKAEGTYFISTNLPIDWSKTWGKMAGQMTGNFYNKQFQSDMTSGLLMEAKMKDKTKKKNNVTKWIVTDVDEKMTTIITSEYQNALTAK